MKRLIFLFLIISFLPKDGFSYPQTEEDYRLLPPFCKARSTPGSPSYSAWDKRLGPNFIHIHHYCSALHCLNQARRTTPNSEKQHQQLFTDCLGGINYMESNSSSDFVLFPHIYVTKADIFTELKDYQDAVKYLNKAIEQNPKFTRAYIKLSDLYSKLNEKSLALETVKKGLAEKPSSTGLNKRLLKLQGKAATESKK
ncbi:MAG: hypothetical protein CTY24_08015 [Methylobacter sp.]|nr:MAG: hypothetical protein CTY24_08015 [Methylobacter sp.]